VGSFTDKEILTYIEESKTLPLNWKMKLKDKPRDKEYSVEIEGDIEFQNDLNQLARNLYKIVVRQRKPNKISTDKSYILNFSVVFCLCLPNTDPIVIKRYCGKYHQHTNRIEDITLPIDFHIHTLTYRYQESYFDDDCFAEVTNRYTNVNDALECLLTDCNFKVAEMQQLPLNGWISI
jgi:hypothetical protein